MKIFKEVMGVVNITFNSALFGASSVQMLCGNFKIATYMLFVVSILYMIGYFAERWSK